MFVQILEDTDEIFVCSVLHWAYQDTVAVILVEEKQVFIYPFGCDWELANEFGFYPLLGIDDIGEDVVGA